MRVYTVHACPSGAEDRDLILVKEGFCWPACLFDFFWALYHRAWKPFLLLVAALCFLEALGHWAVLSGPALLLLLLGWRLLVGFHAKELLLRDLCQKYEHQEIHFAQNYS